jgi:hypothetical protein
MLSQYVTFPTSIREVLVSNIGWNTKDPEVIRGFPQALQANISQIR